MGEFISVEHSQPGWKERLKTNISKVQSKFGSNDVKKTKELSSTYKREFAAEEDKLLKAKAKEDVAKKYGGSMFGGFSPSQYTRVPHTKVPISLKPDNNLFGGLMFGPRVGKKLRPKPQRPKYKWMKVKVRRKRH